jgi:hypothetical protein
MSDAYAILRVKPLKSWSQISAMARHGRRLGEDMDHIDRMRSPINRSGSDWHADAGDLRACIQAVAAHHGAKPRKGAPLGSHLLLTASAGYFRPDDPGALGTWDPARLEAWLSANLKWVRERWPQRVAAWRLDLDESTPHLDVFLVPVHQWKTRGGKTLTQVSHRSAFGSSRRSFTLLQNDYAAAMAPLGLKRGRPRSVTGAVHVHPAVLRRQMSKEADHQRALGVGVPAILRGDLRRLSIGPNGRVSADVASRVPPGARGRLLDLIQPAGPTLARFERNLARSAGRLVKTMMEELVSDQRQQRDEVAVLFEEAARLRDELSGLGVGVPVGIEVRLDALARDLVR